MNLLFITNFFPPLHRGGYEEWCYEVACGLRERGHDVTVLTSRHRRNEINGSEPHWVLRDLHLEMTLTSFRNGLDFFINRRRRQQEDLDRLQMVLDGQAPDAIVIWGMWNLPRSVAAMAETLCPGRVVYYLGDYWPTLPSQYANYWDAPPASMVTAIPKFLLKWPARWIIKREPNVPLQFSHALFCSQFLCESLQSKGVEFGETRVVYGAIDASQYQTIACKKRSRQEESPLTLLYVGRLHPDKGVHTALEAVGHLVQEQHLRDIKLLIAGSGDASYVARLHRLAEDVGITDLAHFLGSVPKEKLPQVYEQADILLFPSVWQEPFGRTLVEGMASGLAIVSTCRGGAGEIVNDGVNALVFDAGDAIELAHEIQSLYRSPQLRERLAQKGYETAVEKFDLSRMIDEIEGCLTSLDV